MFPKKRGCIYPPQTYPVADPFKSTLGRIQTQCARTVQGPALSEAPNSPLDLTKKFQRGLTFCGVVRSLYRKPETEPPSVAPTITPPEKPRAPAQKLEPHYRSQEEAIATLLEKPSVVKGMGAELSSPPREPGGVVPDPEDIDQDEEQEEQPEECLAKIPSAGRMFQAMVPEKGKRPEMLIDCGSNAGTLSPSDAAADRTYEEMQAFETKQGRR